MILAGAVEDMEDVLSGMLGGGATREAALTMQTWVSEFRGARGALGELAKDSLEARTFIQSTRMAIRVSTRSSSARTG